METSTSLLYVPLYCFSRCPPRFFFSVKQRTTVTIHAFSAAPHKIILATMFPYFFFGWQLTIYPSIILAISFLKRLSSMALFSAESTGSASTLPHKEVRFSTFAWPISNFSLLNWNILTIHLNMSSTTTHPVLCSPPPSSATSLALWLPTSYLSTHTLADTKIPRRYSSYQCSSKQHTLFSTLP